MANTGILLLNIGTPQSPEPQEVGIYLKEFLMDPEVINLPWPMRALFVHGLIVPRRKFASAKNYQKIWTERGSPLLVHLMDLAKKLQAELRRFEVDVKFAMRYGDPSIREALVEWSANPPKRIIVAPLYPQYARASTKSSELKTLQIARELKLRTQIEFLGDFYNHPSFIGALQETGLKYLTHRPQHFLFTFHGLPVKQMPAKSCIKAANCCDSIEEHNRLCYRAQSFATARALAKAFHLQSNEWSISFQSRLGRAEWIRPYTDQLLTELPKRGIKDLAVFCPSFVADCLETLEEIGMQGKEAFLEAGGESYQMVPCLNSEDVWVKALAKILPT